MVYLLAFLAVTLSLAYGEVQELTDENFEAILAENEHTLVLFYAPWCKRSRKLFPEYSKAAEILIKYDPPMSLVAVDCTEVKHNMCKIISEDLSYPTLKIFHHGEFVDDYNGPQTSHGIVKYMKAQIRPVSKELSSAEELETLLKSLREPIVVGFFTSNSPMKAVFKQVSETLKVKLRFAHSIFASIPGKKDLVADKVVLYRPLHLTNNFENSSLIYSGKAEVYPLYSFIIKHMHGLVGVRTLDNKEDFHEPLIITYFAINYEFNPKLTSYWRNKVLEVAVEFVDKVSFVISSSDEFASELRGVDFIKSGNPIVMATRSAGRKYLLKEEFSVDSLRQFVKDFLKGNLELFVKSQPVPTSQNEPVIVAVRKSFEKVVAQNDKDTLIEFYAPWCGHCKSLAPIYNELAQQLRHEDIAIVKMDAEANDIPSPYSVTGYPTIYWATKNKKNNPVKYEGRRTVENFIKFIAKEATEELKGWDRKGNAKNIKSEL